jgi:GNAT superfamily N-acetyltransferase
MTHPIVYQRFEDADYIVRAMTPEDVPVLYAYFREDNYVIPKHDLDIALKVFPSNLKGFYIGEYQGEIVASAVHIPWALGSPMIYFASSYYVVPEYRGRGFGTMLRDQVARRHVGDNILCEDTAVGKTADNNEAKYGYKKMWDTGRYEGTAIKGDVLMPGFHIVKVCYNIVFSSTTTWCQYIQPII